MVITYFIAQTNDHLVKFHKTNKFGDNMIFHKYASWLGKVDLKKILKKLQSSEDMALTSHTIDGS